MPSNALLLDRIDLLLPSLVVRPVHALPLLQSPNCLLVPVELGEDDALAELGLVPPWIDLERTLRVLENLFNLELLRLVCELGTRTVSERDIAVGVPVQTTVVALHRRAVFAVPEVLVTLRLLLDGLIVPQAVQDHLLVGIVRGTRQAVVALDDIGPRLRRLLGHIQFEDRLTVPLLDVLLATLAPDTSAHLSLKDRRVFVALEIEVNAVPAEGDVEDKDVGGAHVALDLPPLLGVEAHLDEHGECGLLHPETKIAEVFHEPLFLLLRCILEHLELLDENLVQLIRLCLVLRPLIRVAVGRGHELAILIHEHRCALHIFVPLHVRTIRLALIPHQPTPELARRFLNELDRDQPIAAAVLRHRPIALLPIELLVSGSVEAPDHVPGRAATALADFDATLGEPDHHVVRREVLHALPAVPLARDLVDLAATAATLIGRPQLNRDAIAVVGLVGVDVVKLLRRSEEVMRLHIWRGSRRT
mmetsp:Transcript_94244/g.191851  ORF Transcript_94244/g.191851 Transcript_94244/m.191851 type:complete len:476 (+) Transcript_94244:327-1754(+)